MNWLMKTSHERYDDASPGARPQEPVADGLEQVGLPEADAPVDEQRVVARPGCSATARAAPKATWFAPTTKFSKV